MLMRLEQTLLLRIKASIQSAAHNTKEVAANHSKANILVLIELGNRSANVLVPVPALLYLS